MNSNNTKEKLKDSGKCFYAKVYRINKGKNKHSYFATIRKEEIQNLSIKDKDAVLLEISNKVFPSFIRKLKTSKNRFMLGFTVPFKIGKNLPLKSDTTFNFLQNNISYKIPNSKHNINLSNIIPSKTIRNYPFYLFDLKNSLMIWIYSGGTKPYILPKHIPIDKNNLNLFEYAGAFFCEGFKARKENNHRDRFSFSNADSEQIEFFLNASEKLLNIPKKEWKTQILHPDLNQISNLTKFWSKLGISREKIKIIENKTVLAKQGVCILSIYNSTLAETIYHLMEHLEKESLKSKENAINFFRGLSRGDIGIASGNCTITLSTENKRNVILFQKICYILEITTAKPYFSQGCWNISIHNYKNFIKIINLDILTHTKRRNRFIKKFKELKNNGYLAYLDTVYLGCNTTKESADYLNLSIITTRFYLAKLKKEGFLTAKINENSRHKQLIYNLTEKGRKHLKFYQKVMDYENN